jgi:monovalent cation:H+ antiporter-2, CPA2 family
VQEDFRLIVDIVVVLAAAAGGGFLAAILRQPVLLGYLLGGAIVGPAGLGLVKELIQVETLASLERLFCCLPWALSSHLLNLRKFKALA